MRWNKSSNEMMDFVILQFRP